MRDTTESFCCVTRDLFDFTHITVTVTVTVTVYLLHTSVQLCLSLYAALFDTLYLLVIACAFLINYLSRSS
jgi:hypothetical protein